MSLIIFAYIGWAIGIVMGAYYTLVPANKVTGNKHHKAFIWHGIVLLLSIVVLFN